MGVNKVILLGNLGKDPELKYTASNTAIANLRLATGERRKDASGNWADHTEWHSVVCFGKTAENCSQFLKKGRQVFVEGRIQTRKWQDKEGHNRYSTEIIANTIQFVGGRDAPSNGYQQGAATSESIDPSVLQGMQSADALAEAGAGSGEVGFDDDDIPF